MKIFYETSFISQNKIIQKDSRIRKEMERELKSEFRLSASLHGLIVLSLLTHLTSHQSLNVQCVFPIAQQIFLIALGISWSPWLLVNAKRLSTKYLIIFAKRMIRRIKPRSEKYGLIFLLFVRGWTYARRGRGNE